MSRWIALSVCLVGALSIAGCGSSSSSEGVSSAPKESSSAATAEAKKIVAAAEAPKSEWTGPTSAPKPVTGKTIGVMPCGQAIEGCARQSRGVIEAAKTLGWDTVLLDPQFDPQKTNAAMSTFINKKVDAIVISSLNPATIGDGIGRAKARGIPTVATFATDPTPVGGIASVSIDDHAAGEAVAAYISTNGGGNVAIFNNNDSPPVAVRATALKEGLLRFGNAKVINDQAVPGNQIGPPEEQMMAALMKRFPKGKIDWVFTGFDAMLTPLVQSAQRAGRTEIKGISFDGNQQNLGFIRDDQGQVAVVGYPLEWAGWGAVDQLNRFFNDKPLAKNEGVQFRLLTKATIPPEGEPYTGDVDFRSKFRELWGK